MKTLEKIAHDLNLQGTAITEDFAIIYNHGLYNDIKPMKTQHTPGPWKLAVGVIGPDKVWMEDSQGNETMICRGVENEHDARLIAAAPELLAALQRLTRAMDDYDGDIPADINSPHHQALAAIAKATGGQL